MHQDDAATDIEHCMSMQLLTLNTACRWNDYVFNGFWKLNSDIGMSVMCGGK